MPSAAPRGRRRHRAVRRGIFGGSFDPVHFGHLRVAAAAADQLGLDRVHFVPARAQPLKGGHHEAPAADRVAMLRLALEGDPRFVLDLQEIERPGPSYTVHTLQEVRRAYPQDLLFLLVGADAARDLPAWHEAARLPQLATIVVLTRPGVTPPGGPLVNQLLVVSPVDISATAIRERIRRAEPIGGLVPDAVARYIVEQGLYAGER